LLGVQLILTEVEAREEIKVGTALSNRFAANQVALLVNFVGHSKNFVDLAFPETGVATRYSIPSLELWRPCYSSFV